MPVNRDPARLVGALVNGVKVMRYLAKSTEMVGVNQVARDLQLAPSTAYNILRTLVHERLAVFESTSKTYGPGPAVADLVNGSLHSVDQRRLIRPHLQQIADKHSITVALWRRDPDEHAVLIDSVEAASAVRIRMEIGQRLPLYLGAMGRCFAAHSGLDKAALRQKFQRLRWDGKVSFERYFQEVEGVKETGVAVDESNFERGVTSVAAAVIDGSGDAVMAISAIGIAAQNTGGKLIALGGDVRAAAARASRAIGGRTV